MVIASRITQNRRTRHILQAYIHLSELLAHCPQHSSSESCTTDAARYTIFVLAALASVIVFLCYWSGNVEKVGCNNNKCPSTDLLKGFMLLRVI
jgi:hypothetical protein